MIKRYSPDCKSCTVFSVPARLAVCWMSGGVLEGKLSGRLPSGHEAGGNLKQAENPKRTENKGEDFEKRDRGWNLKTGFRLYFLGRIRAVSFNIIPEIPAAALNKKSRDQKKSLGL